jgi:hypothetical protein
MKSVVKLFILSAFLFIVSVGSAKTVKNTFHSSPAITSASANNLVSENCPIPAPTSLIVYRFRHGIDKGPLVVSQPIEVVLYIIPSIHLCEDVVSTDTYFSTQVIQLPSPPDFLGCFSLRAPPFSC